MMHLNTPDILKGRVRELVYAKAEADGMGVDLIERVKAHPRLGPLYRSWKKAQEGVFEQEAKLLGAVGETGGTAGAVARIFIEP
jgi:L-2-hydroxyglutarate oxidase LhgO